VAAKSRLGFRSILRRPREAEDKGANREGKRGEDKGIQTINARNK